MVEIESKPADTIYSKMLDQTPATVAPLAYGITLWLDRTNADVSTQITSLAATLICMLQKYDLSHIDVLSIADNIVHSDRYNNIQPVFRTVMESITEEM